MVPSLKLLSVFLALSLGLLEVVTANEIREIQDKAENAAPVIAMDVLDYIRLKRESPYGYGYGRHPYYRPVASAAGFFGNNQGRSGSLQGDSKSDSKGNARSSLSGKFSGAGKVTGGTKIVVV